MIIAFESPDAGNERTLNGEYRVTFDGARSEITDSLLRTVRVLIERATGEPLPINPQTGFPFFTIYDDDGTEVMGG